MASAESLGVTPSNDAVLKINGKLNTHHCTARRLGWEWHVEIPTCVGGSWKGRQLLFATERTPKYCATAALQTEHRT